MISLSLILASLTKIRSYRGSSVSKSNLVAFRVPADLQDAFNQAVAASGGDKSAWLVDAIRSKLNRPVADSDKRMLVLVE